VSVQTPVPATPASGERPPRPARLLFALAGTPVLRWLVARHSVAPGQPPRTGCDRCGAAVSLTGPGWAALLPTGRCGRCRQRVGASPYLLEILAVAAAAAAALSAPSVPVLLAGLWWAGWAAALFFVDLRVHRLPDALTFPAAAGVVALLALDAAVRGSWAGLVRAVVTAIVAGGVFLLVALILGRRGMGVGDAKLILSVAALLGWWGWGAAFLAVLLAFVAAGVVGGVLLATRRASRATHIAMGPFFVAATVGVLALLAVVPPA
jgi:leader peptidase (prepilin peptidase)/N-methyltransferase